MELRIPNWFRCFVLLASLLGGLAWSVPSYADDTEDKKELSRARAMFQQAIELEQAGNFPNALQLFREVGQVRMTPQVQFHIALCEENLGRLVTAMGGYELALEGADQVGTSFKAEVEQKRTELKARIPKLIIVRGKGAEAATIELDGVPLGASRIGIENEVDPGPHQIAAKAPGHENFVETVSVQEEERRTVKVELEKLPEGAVAGGGGMMDAGAPEKKSRLIPYIVIGAGGAVLLASGVFLIMRQSALGDLNTLCPDRNCPDSLTPAERREANDLHDSVGTYGTISLVTAIIGVATVGAGVTLYILQDKKEKSDESETAQRRVRGRSLRLEASAPMTNAGLSLVGQF
jgi:hypothetical protein